MPINLKSKKEILGPDNLPLPGGQCQKEEETAGRARQSDFIPVFYHEGPELMAFQVAHFLTAAAIIDLTPGWGYFALWALKHRLTLHRGLPQGPPSRLAAQEDGFPRAVCPIIKSP